MPWSLFQRPRIWVPLLAFIAYLPAAFGGFVYDDILLISSNAYVQDLVHWRHAFSSHFWDVSGMSPSADPIHYYRPLVTLSYLLNWLASPNQAWSFHLTNAIVHGTNTWLVLVIGQRFTRSALLGTACALLFALHPSRAEAVIWISGRPDPLMTLFLLVAVQIAYLGRDGGRRLRASLGVVVCFSAALLCKEPALAGPLLFAIDAVDAPKRERRWHLFMIGLTAALAAGYLALRHAFLPVGSPPLTWTPAHALVTVTHYLERIVFPWPLTFFYQLEELGPNGPIHASADIVAGGVIAVGGLALGVYAARRDKTALVLLLAAVAFVGPLLNLTSTGSKFTAADRFLYLPLWLLSLGVGRLFKAPLTRLFAPRPARVLGAGFLLICVVLNTTRALDFVSSLTLWNGELALNPDNPAALRGRSGQWASQGARALAIRDLEHSLQNRSLRYHTLATRDYNADAYARLITLRSQLIADGSPRDLRLLAADAVDRLAGRRRSSRSDLLDIDWPADEASARWTALEGEEAIAPHLVLLTTRLDLHEISTALLDAIPDRQLHLTPNPLLVAIAEAREGRFDRALGRVDTMKRRRFLMPDIVTRNAIADVEARIRSAQGDFTRGELTAGHEGHRARTRAFATLGAYGRALVEAQKAKPTEPEMLPFYAQLLVFARLESVALDAATRALGPERARTILESIRNQLPPELRTLPAVEPPPRTPAPPDL